MIAKARTLRLLTVFSLYGIGILLLVCCFPLQSATREIHNYLCISGSFVWLGIIFLLGTYKYDIDLLEPVCLITGLYLALFIFAPIKCILSNDFSAFGVDVMDGCIRGTLIFTLSLTAFYAGYWWKGSYKIPRKPLPGLSSQVPVRVIGGRIVSVCYVIWFACMLLTLVYEVSVGRSPLYSLSFAQFGNGNPDAGFETSLGILVNFEFCLIGCMIYILYYGKNLLGKIGVCLLTLSLLYVRGFRFIMLIALVAPVIFWYIKHYKRPQVTTICTGILGFTLLFATIGGVRGALRSGQEYNFHVSSLSDSFEDIFQSDFSIFKSYYAIVDKIPDNLPYQYGKEIVIYTAIMMVPRAIWPSKPLPLQHPVTTAVINEQAALSGFASPNLAEFYFEWGIVGCIVCMFIFGRLANWLKRLARPDNDDKLILYSILLPACMQLIARGYVPSNFYLVLFLVLPVFIVKKYRSYLLRTYIKLI